MPKNGTVRAAFLNSEITTLVFQTTSTFSELRLLQHTKALVTLFQLALR